MKLLVDCHCFDYPLPQGINTYIKGLYCSLITVASDIDFYFAANNIEIIRNIFGTSSNVHYLKIEKTNSINRLLFNYPKLIIENNIDVAHFQYVSPFGIKCKKIITLHDILFEDYPQYFPLSYRISKRIFFKKSAREADLLCTVSEYSKERIALRYGIRKDNIFVTSNAVNNQSHTIPKLKAQEIVLNKFNIDKYILYVSRIEPRKNQIGLIKAFIEGNFYKLGYKLVIVGQISLRDKQISHYLESLDNKIKSSIIFLNNINNKDLEYIYRAATLFVYPALAEGFGIPPLEAAMAEIPTICNNATAMSEFKFFGQRHINTSDHRLLIKAMVNTLNYPPTDEELSNIRSNILETYNWTRIAKDFYIRIKNII